MKLDQTTANLLKTVTLGAAALTLTKPVFSSGPSESEKPNIIFIMSDDHTFQAISSYNSRLADICPTPNIDRLAEEGMRFNQCFVTNSISSPSRASIMTGMYSHENGVYKFTPLAHDQPTLPKEMQDAGYQTSIIGKYHLHSNPVGFDYYSVLPGQGAYHNPEFIEKGDQHPSGWVAQGGRTRYEGHSSDVIADQALEYLKKQKNKDQPFMFFCHFKAPHDMWKYASRYGDFLEDTRIPEPASLFENYQGKSDALKKTTQKVGNPVVGQTAFEERTSHLEGRARKKKAYQIYMKKYLRCVKGVDDNVGRILDYLEQSGMDENTIVIYTGDQGFFLGEHGLYDKRFMYEQALRMPLLIRWPNHVESGKVNREMILNIDFAPTILEAAGVEPPERMQGRSFLPMLKGEDLPNWRDAMYYRYYYSHFRTEPHYGVRTQRYKLISFHRLDQWELYDLKRDPREMNNVYGDPGYEEVAEMLKHKLDSLQEHLVDDPGDHGRHPDVGSLAPDPLYSTSGVKIGQEDASLLMRFCTGVGGTLISQSNLDEGVYNIDYTWKGDKTLYIRDSKLIWNDSGETSVIAEGINDKQWHTLALVVKNQKPRVYVDGKLTWKGPGKIVPSGSDDTFNIGAGLDNWGFNGYNFIGTISEVRFYDDQLDKKSIEAYSRGEVPDGKLKMKWKN